MLVFKALYGLLPAVWLTVRKGLYKHRFIRRISIHHFESGRVFFSGFYIDGTVTPNDCFANGVFEVNVLQYTANPQPFGRIVIVTNKGFMLLPGPLKCKGVQPTLMSQTEADKGTHSWKISRHILKESLQK